MEEGFIVKVQLPQPDGSFKLRPALILKKMRSYDDLLLCGISSQLHQYKTGFDELINEQHPDYKTSGLIKPSVVRLGLINTMSSSRIEGKLGEIAATTHQRLLGNLAAFLKKE